MRYSTFGRRSGLRVSQLGLGTGNFGTAWGAGADEGESRRMFDRFAEAGGTLIDTADIYQSGESEQFVGRFLGADRDEFVVASKYTSGTGGGGLGTTGNHRKNLMRSVENSLQRLGLESIDLLWVHFPDQVTPLEEVLRGLDDLVSDGKVHYGGLSNFPAWQVAWGAATADAHSWAPIAGIQVEHSLVERTAEHDLLPMAEALGLGTTLWSPLGGGLLTGKYRHSSAGRLTDWGRVVHREDNDRKTTTVDTVMAVADELAMPPSRVATAWSLARAARASTTVVPIIGPRSVAQLEDYLAALHLALDDEQLNRLDTASSPPRPVPHQAVDDAHDGILGGRSAHFDPPPVPVP